MIKPKIRVEPCDNGYVVTTYELPEGKIVAKQVFMDLTALLDYIEDTYVDREEV